MSENAVSMPKIGFTEKLGFLMLSLASNIVFAFKSSYYLFFLTDVCKIDVAVAGIIVMIGTIWDAINDPLVGYSAVNRKFKSGERIRPMILRYAFPLGISVVLLFTNWHLKDLPAAIVATVIYIVFELMNTFMSVPYNSMASLATNSNSDRRSINAYRNLGGCLGSAIGAVACLPLLKLFGAMDGTGNLIESASSAGFMKTAALMGFIIALGAVFHYFTTKERVKPINSDETKLGFFEIFRMLMRSRSFVMNTVFIFLYGTSSFLLLTDIVYYCRVVLGSAAKATMIQAVYIVFSVISSFIISPIDRKLGRGKCMALGAIVMIVGKIWFVFSPESLPALYLVAASVGFGMTASFVAFNTNRNIIVDLVEWKEGRRLDSMVSTVDNLMTKLGQALVTLINSMLLSRAGYDATLAVLPDSVAPMLEALIGWIPLVVAVFMAVIGFLFPIEKEVAEMNRAKGLGAEHS